ncbi:zinc finger protein 511-like [Mya arenaria]|uniref:zinc finger protein 511-like n=1 Tax=Mya arenaria TaxID=6604 RepID=UPI0022E7488F|nr:zinc finger protein 511-like [Mya arenaria]
MEGDCSNEHMSENMSGSLQPEVNKTGPMFGWCWKLKKRRLEPGHKLFQDGDLYCHLNSKYVPLDMKTDLPMNSTTEFPCGIAKCSQLFSNLAKYESHYNSCHRHVCSTCSRAFPIDHLLSMHMLENHDAMFAVLAEKQPMFQCLLADCGSKFKDGKSRRNHMVKVHHYPANFRFDRPSKKTKEKHPKNGEKNGQSVDSKGEGQSVAMETQSTPDDSHKESPARVFSYKVPNNISFGHGASRGFMGRRSRGQRSARGQRGHWHNKGQCEMDTTVDIEQVDMAELGEALS